MHAQPLRHLSILALSAALGLAGTSTAVAQNEQAAEIAQEQANENAEDAGADAGASASSTPASDNANAGAAGNAEANSPGPEDGHDCTGVGHTTSEGLGHSQDECEPEGGATALMSGQSRAVLLGSVPAVNAAIEECDEDTLNVRATEEDLQTFATASTADLYEIKDCTSAEPDSRVRDTVGANANLVTVIEGAGFTVDHVVTGTVQGDTPVLYLERE